MSRQKEINALTSSHRESVYKWARRLAGLVSKINLETDLCAWFDDAGHVSWFSVRVCTSKEYWNRSQELYRNDHISYRDQTERDFIDECLEAEEELRKLYEQGRRKKHAVLSQLQTTGEDDDCIGIGLPTVDPGVTPQGATSDLAGGQDREVREHETDPR